MHLVPPYTPDSLLTTLQGRRDDTPRLADYPDLALAATATNAELDTQGDVFAAVSACLDTLARLKLNVTTTRLLLLLVKNGPDRCKCLCADLRTTPANLTPHLVRLRALGLITTQRGTSRREVIVTATDAARKVLASIVGLTALGMAANCLRKR